MIYEIPTYYTLTDVIRVIIAITLIFAVISAVFFIVWGWLWLIISGWQDHKVKEGIGKIRYSVIWLITLVLILFIMPAALNMFFWIDVSQELWPQKILNSAKNIWMKIMEK